jgi:hypothetical protein
MNVMCDGFRGIDLDNLDERASYISKLVKIAWSMVSCNNNFIPAEAGLSVTLDILARTEVCLATPEYYAECLEHMHNLRKSELASVRADVLWGRIGHLILDTRMKLESSLSDEQVNAAWTCAWGREFVKGATDGTVSLTRRERVTVEQFTFALECVLRQQLGRYPTNPERKHVEKLGAEIYSLEYRLAPWHTTL